ncbi:MAG: hypothetical protein APF81_26225 [Desulfosporosinus sp. BRH_c37]|nr:MAG: hypothetical protein APF81_26225 [Desulfosporosinus sp. BRH_c37]
MSIRAANWTIAQRDRYFSIAERCDKETLLQRHYSMDIIRKKKEYMESPWEFSLFLGSSPKV